MTDVALSGPSHGCENQMDAGEKVDRPSIFKALLTPADGYVVPTPEQLKDEALSILAAAADTTGNAMTVAAYHVVNNPEIMQLCQQS
jgi:cytochrome P450